ncbi:MAG TPA: ScpA family protein [Caulobacteraceae bacterium]|nr:ScpA family protein [Caulobacteraceae bacterium]
MTREPFQQKFDFTAAGVAAEEGEGLIVDLDGYEGPLHVLLALARSQKVDLLKLSILKLAEQYLAFVQSARRQRFALAADYLVMAAWLTYLKSRLLLPRRERATPDEPPAEEAAQGLAFRLAKLDSMRRAAEALAHSPQLGRNVFVRGDPDAVRILATRELEGDLYGLMRAYADQRRSHAARYYRPALPQAYPLDEARARLRGLMPRLEAWRSLSHIAPSPDGEGGPSRASYLASTLSASLELVKEGALEARQIEPFHDLYLRSRARLEARP